LELENRCKDYYIPDLYLTKYTGHTIAVDNYDEPVYKIKVDDEEVYENINKDNFKN
jgi:hypothetical protein